MARQALARLIRDDGQVEVAADTSSRGDDDPVRGRARLAVVVPVDVAVEGLARVVVEVVAVVGRRGHVVADLAGRHARCGEDAAPRVVARVDAVARAEVTVREPLPVGRAFRIPPRRRVLSGRIGESVVAVEVIRAVPGGAAVAEARELLALGVLRVALQRLIRLRVVEPERRVDARPEHRPDSDGRIDGAGEPTSGLGRVRPPGEIRRAVPRRSRGPDERDRTGSAGRAHERPVCGLGAAVLAGVLATVSAVGAAGVLVRGVGVLPVDGRP